MLARMPTQEPDVPRTTRPPSRLAFVTCGALSGLLACGTPGVRGVAGTAPAPNVAWTPPARESASATAAPPRPPALALPSDIADRVAQLRLADGIDMALRNNTATSAAWADRGAPAGT